MRQRFVDGRVERLTDFAEPLQSQFRQCEVQPVSDELETALDFAMGPRPVYVVEHWEQPQQHRPQRLLTDCLTVAFDPAAVVGKLCVQALQIVGPFSKLLFDLAAHDIGQLLFERRQVVG